MEFFIHIPLILIMITILSALIIPMCKGQKTPYAITVFSFSSVCLLSIYMIFVMLNNDVTSFNYQLGSVSAPFSNELKGGIYEGIMSFALSLIMLLSIVGGKNTTDYDIEESKKKYFYLILNLLLSSILALIFTNDIFTAYVFVEINAIAACSIVVIKKSKNTIKATIKYFFMSLLGSGIFLFGISTLYSITGHLNMEFIKVAIENLNPNYYIPLSTSFVLICVGLFVKSALFPFHTWLPDAHGSATPTASAILSGVVLKGYIILLIKIIYRVYGFQVVSDLNLFNIMFALGIAGMIIGSVFAMTQRELKKMIAYSSVAQIGYIYLGIGLGTEIGLLAASFHILVHGFTKSMLFLSAGNFLNLRNSYYIEDLEGMGRVDLVSGISFTVGALSMIGIPILSGFASKFMFIESALDSKFIIIILGALIISTLLNGMYYIPVIIRIFGKNISKDKLNKNHFMGSSQRIVLVILIVTNFLIGIFSREIFSLLRIGIENIG